MVYYTPLPLMMKTEPNTTQICTNTIKSENDSVRLSNLSNNTIYTESLYSDLQSAPQPGKPMIFSDTNGLAQPQPHHTVQISHTQQQQTHQPQQPQQQQAIPRPPKPQFKCEQCNMLFGSKSAHTSHIKSHAKLVQQQIGQPSTSVSVSVNDVLPNNISSSDPYQCDVCKKTFAVPARLVRHYRTHTGERPFECEFCHKMFSVKENLQVHRRIHTKERPYKCEVCGRAFEHSGKLHRHMRIHTGERPHKCSVCGKTFIQSGQLVIHMRTHTGEKPYKCPVEGCGKGFTCSKQLKVHSRTHTGEKPYHCDICFRDFGYNHVLKLHRVQHYGSKCYKCTICDETFKSKKEMEAHIKGHANEMPDEEDGTDSNISSYTIGGDDNEPRKIETDTSNSSMQIKSADDLLLETPRESSSEATSDGDELYYNMYSRYGQSASGYMPTSAGVNPALLAAVSIAASASAAEFNEPRASSTSTTSQIQKQCTMRPTSPIQQHHHIHQIQAPPPPPPPLVPLQKMRQLQDPALPNEFIYEPIEVMRQQGFFSAVPKVEQYRSSIEAASEIVKRVEAAIAGAEPMLTPPRSSPESPERSSSPESDSTLMVNRDNMSLPLRKRKLYLKDNQSEESPVMRMSSVIQFAKAS